MQGRGAPWVRIGLGIEVDDRQGGIIICRVCEPNESVPVGDLLQRGRRVGIEGPSSHSTAASRIRIGLSSVVGMDCRELLVEWILFDWALSSRALGHGEWPGIPGQQAMPRVGRGAQDVPDT